GNGIFFSRFFVQWLATEKHKRVVVPNAFWWLSLFGSLCLLSYGVHQRDSVFIFAYAFTWIPYIRNLVISRRVKTAEQQCASCDTPSRLPVRFCPVGGFKLPDPASPSG